jgi:hypothetical protein
MPIHKFISKYYEDTISWVIKDDVKYQPERHDTKWEIFAQQSITIQPKTVYTAVLGFGISFLADGLCLVSLKQELKLKRLSLQDGIILENVDDIIVNIQNNSDHDITINEGQSLCFINYYNS